MMLRDIWAEKLYESNAVGVPSRGTSYVNVFRFDNMEQGISEMRFADWDFISIILSDTLLQENGTEVCYKGSI